MHRALFLRGLSRHQRLKAALLSSWFFVAIATLWLLKPVRVASLLAHLGATETPYVRLAGVVTVAATVAVYSIVVNRVSRVKLARGSNLLFGALLVAFWLAIRIGGPALGAQRPFVWAVYILVEIYSVVMIGIFWTYTNDIVTTAESNALYGVIGLGGVLGGVAGGAFVDLFARRMGSVNLLLVCAALVVVSAALASLTEATLKPAHRPLPAEIDHPLAEAVEGAREVLRSRYLVLLVAIVVAYEFTATLTDFGVNVIFERAYPDEADLTQMYGRLGWIVSGTAIFGQLALVPLLLPWKRAALMLSPLVMLGGALGALLLPGVAMAMVLSAADRGLNYSLQQSTKESLYVPLSDVQKYKAKAFIDMFVDRAAKAAAAFVLIGVIAVQGASVQTVLAISVGSMFVWVWAAHRLGAFWEAPGAITVPEVAAQPAPVAQVAPVGAERRQSL